MPVQPVPYQRQRPGQALRRAGLDHQLRRRPAALAARHPGPGHPAQCRRCGPVLRRVMTARSAGVPRRAPGPDHRQRRGHRDRHVFAPFLPARRARHLRARSIAGPDLMTVRAPDPGLRRPRRDNRPASLTARRITSRTGSPGSRADEPAGQIPDEHQHDHRRPAGPGRLSRARRHPMRTQLTHRRRQRRGAARARLPLVPQRRTPRNPAAWPRQDREFPGKSLQPG